MHTRILVVLACLAPVAAFADDLTGFDLFVCTSWHAARCSADGTCDNAAPWRFNIPDFLRLDLPAKVITTTAAHSEERTTPIDGVQRADGLIVLHGRQGDRAWSRVIKETSGEGTLAVSSEDAGVTIFSACTPIEALTKSR
jgi:hypothetical protein